jgi:hypothetical protein
MPVDDSPSVVKSVARSTGLAKLYRLFVRTPLNRIRKSIREGGPIEQWKTRRGEQAMREAAADLPPLSPPPRPSDSPRRIYFLTGKDFWHQTLFCFVSLQQHCQHRITPVIYGDGTLRSESKSRIRRVVPWVEFVKRDEIEARLDASLPASKYPTLRERRLKYVHLRKLTDFHAGSTGAKLVLDSDMLFFDRPSLLIEWLEDPERPLHMQDAVETYGYSRELMEELAGASIPERVNVGIVGLSSEKIDWDQLEYWCRTLQEEEGVKYVQEQALTAMLVANHDRTVAPRLEYLTLPSVKEGRSPSVTLHHYVAESKRAYFQYGWRQVVNSIFDSGNPGGNENTPIEYSREDS